MTSPNSLLQCNSPTVWQDNTQTYTHPPPYDTRVATGTYKALSSIIHEAQLEALLVLKGLCQGVTQVVRGQGTLPTVLELGENALKKRVRSGFAHGQWHIVFTALFVTFNAKHTVWLCDLMSPTPIMTRRDRLLLFCARRH